MSLPLLAVFISTLLAVKLEETKILAGCEMHIVKIYKVAGRLATILKLLTSRINICVIIERIRGTAAQEFI